MNARTSVLGVIFFVLLCGGALASAEGVGSAVFNSPLTPAAKTELLGVFHKLAQAQTVRGSFLQSKHLTKLKRNFEAKGTFVFSSGHGIWWQVETPFRSLTIMTTTKLIQKTADGRTSSLEAKDNPVFGRFAATIQAVFAGDAALIEKDFSLYFEQKAAVWTIGLIPKEDSVKKVIQSMILVGTNYLSSVEILEGAGDTLRYEFPDAVVSGPLSDNDQKKLFQ